MNLIFERGDRDAPVGHALMYFTAEAGAVLATYVSVPPIKFDLSKFVPEFLAGAMQGMDMGDSMVAAPIPPIPEEVPSLEYLHALAARRHDDLIFAGGTMRADPMRLAAETAEAARLYGELYQESPAPEKPIVETEIEEIDSSRFEGMNEQAQLNELTNLTGRLRDSMRNGGADPTIEHEMQSLARLLPPKYRAHDLIAAASIPGERGQKLADLYLQRCYKLYQEEYLDLERIDREIEAIGG
jgi:hypothetical protein